MQRLVGEFDEARLDVDLGHGLVHGFDDGFAFGEHLVRCRHHDHVRPVETGGNRRDDLAGGILAAIGGVEELGEFLRGGMVESIGTCGDGDLLQIFNHAVDVVVFLNAESARAEDGGHALKPGDVLERDGHTLLQIRGVVADDVGVGRLAELAEDIGERGFVAFDIDERHKALVHGAGDGWLFGGEGGIVLKVDFIDVLELFQGLGGGLRLSFGGGRRAVQERRSICCGRCGG